MVQFNRYTGEHSKALSNPAPAETIALTSLSTYCTTNIDNILFILEYTFKCKLQQTSKASDPMI